MPAEKNPDWPEFVGPYIEYRGYIVEPHWFFGWQYVHKDYDGPEDNRAGHENTYEDCLVAIDEREDD